MALTSPRQQLSVHQIILCFDGTGNKFSGGTSPSMSERENELILTPGTSADSNILKIYGMLDRTNGDKHYYQVFPAEVSITVV